MSTPVEAAVAGLRARHERVTPARRAVLEVLGSTASHLNAEEIVTLAAGRAPGVHRATIYRALATLGELGLVTHTHLGTAAAVYHLSGSAGTHGHARCGGCGTVLDVPADVLAPVAERLAADFDFALDLPHSGLLGRCRACRAPAHRPAEEPGTVS